MTISNVKITGDIAAEILSNSQTHKEINNYIKGQFQDNKERALNEFDNHDVTQELLNPEGGNISNTLGGYGDLFGFIGFKVGSEPTAPVRRVLESKIKFKNTDLETNYPRNKKGQFARGKRSINIKINFEVPDLDDFNKAARFDGWNGGRNWVKGIERGISGVSYYADYSRGRSQRGVQLKGEITNGPENRPSVFETRGYITEIVNNFIKDFSTT